MGEKRSVLKKNWISIVLITAGLLIIAYPVVGQLYARYQEEKMLEEWLNAIDTGGLEDAGGAGPDEAYAQLKDVFGAESSEDSSQEAAAGDEEDRSGQAGGGGAGAAGTGDDPGGSSGGSSGGKSPPVIDMSKQKVLGIIQIPKIKLKEPIVEGVEKSNLKAGIGHIPGTPLPGEPGNCAMAGHRNYAWKKFFRRLDELKEGDEVTILTQSETLRYSVTGKLVVEPDDVSVLAGSMDQSIISMITCTPMYVHSHRLIVTAELVERVPRES
jgi:sortase A